MSWLVPRLELTPQQLRAIELSPDAHRAIIGGPGSGKTQVLLHRAHYLCERYNVSRDRFRIFVYTNVLKNYIRSALQDLNLPEGNVLTFASWCSDYYKEHIGRQLPWNNKERMPDFAVIRRAVMRHATGGAVTSPLFDFVLVDEGQDLEAEIFEFLDKISMHVTVCLDSKQQIYETGTSTDGILSKLRIRHHNVNLIDAYRVCPYLVEVAAEFIPDRGDREAFRNQTRQPQTERQTPLVFFARNAEDEKQMLVQIMRERLLKNERIAVLFPQRRQVYGFAAGLTEAGIDVEVPEQPAGDLPVHDFASPRPKLMPYHSAKGLTFDTVLMPRLVSNAFHRVDKQRVERLLFVGITRATKWCYFSTDQNRPLPLLEQRIKQLTARNQVTLIKSDMNLLYYPNRYGDDTADTADRSQVNFDDNNVDEHRNGDLSFL